MNTYQPWTVSFIELMKHNASAVVWLIQRLSNQFHSRSDFTSVTTVTLCFALAQLMDQAGHLLHLLGITMSYKG